MGLVAAVSLPFGVLVKGPSFTCVPRKAVPCGFDTTGAVPLWMFGGCCVCLLHCCCCLASCLFHSCVLGLRFFSPVYCSSLPARFLFLPVSSVLFSCLSSFPLSCWFSLWFLSPPNCCFHRSAVLLPVGFWFSSWWGSVWLRALLLLGFR